MPQADIHRFRQIRSRGGWNRDGIINAAFSPNCTALASSSAIKQFTMRYFRERSLFVWLGLLAIAGQIVLTVGHLHAAHEDSVRKADFGLFDTTRHHRELPTNPNDLDGSCALCWTIAQAGSLILHRPATIRTGRLHQTLRLPYRTVELLSCGRTSPFESRGPPLTSTA